MACSCREPLAPRSGERVAEGRVRGRGALKRSPSFDHYFETISMSALGFFAAVLAVWRVTHLIVVEDGPWDLMRRLRRTGERIGLERLINCFLCCSVWVAVPFAFLVARGWEVAVAVPALSGGAILLERLTRERDAAAAWIESKEE